MDAFKGKFPHIPERISRLGELACNLWWSWHPEARAIFHMLAGNGSEFRTYNPVKLLHELEGSVLEAAKDSRFLRHYDAVMARFDAEMDTYSSWFYSKVADPRMLQIAYFSAEYGLHHSLPFYAGGLGFLAGDFLKECSDLGVPVVGVGFMYPEGYLHQKLSTDGWQMVTSEMLDREKAPICHVLDKNGQPLVIKVPIAELPVYFEVWKANVGRVTLYLMDTDIDGNDPWNRGMSARLYIGDPEQRLVQEIILGIGGSQMLKAPGVEHSILHLNEGHPAFAMLERLREKLETGLSSEMRPSRSRPPRFSPRTPRCPRATMSSPSSWWTDTLPVLPYVHPEPAGLLRPGDLTHRSPQAGFNMTAFALRLSDHRNAVSRKHGEVARRMWQPLWPQLPVEQVPIDHITNGVHVPTWISRKMELRISQGLKARNGWRGMRTRRSGRRWLTTFPTAEFWSLHLRRKIKLIDYIRERTRRRWVEDRVGLGNVVVGGALARPGGPDHRLCQAVCHLQAGRPDLQRSGAFEKSPQ